MTAVASSGLSRDCLTVNATVRGDAPLPSTSREPISPRSVTSSINHALVVGRDTLDTTRAVQIVASRMPMREGA
jgi:hypothetical protein